MNIHIYDIVQYAKDVIWNILLSLNKPYDFWLVLLMFRCMTAQTTAAQLLGTAMGAAVGPFLGSNLYGLMQEAKPCNELFQNS